MASEKRLIDKLDAVKLLRGWSVAKYPNSFLMGLLAAATEIEQMPTVDAVEVVRCKDCKHRADATYKGNYLCNRKMLGLVRPGDFCSYGERTDNEP